MVFSPPSPRQFVDSPLYHRVSVLTFLTVLSAAVGRTEC